MNRLALIIALVAGAAAGGLFYLYQQRMETEMSGGQRVPVLVALKPLSRGDIVAENALGIREVPVSYLAGRSIPANHLDRVVGLKMAGELDSQSFLLWSDLALSGETTRDVSSLISTGRVAFSVSASKGGDVSALIRPGDYVNVLATLSPSGGKEAAVVLLQRILVLAVGVSTSPGTKKRSKRKTSVTLSLKLEEAQLLSLAQKRGDLSVVLRNPNDPETVADPPDISMDVLGNRKQRVVVVKKARSSGPTLPVRLENNP
jgi:pilus assembly protein CpaB